MFRNMVTSLFKHGRIRTTEAKAKELRRWADQLITLAKRGDLHARRQAFSIIREKDVVHKLFEQAADKFKDICGGYTRIFKIGRRKGDASLMALIEIIPSSDRKTDSDAPKKNKGKKEKAKAKKEIEPVEKVSEQKVDTSAEDTSVIEEGATDKAEEAPEEVVAEDTPVIEEGATDNAEEAPEEAVAEDIPANEEEKPEK